MAQFVLIVAALLFVILPMIFTTLMKRLGFRVGRRKATAKTAAKERPEVGETEKPFLPPPIRREVGVKMARPVEIAPSESTGRRARVSITDRLGKLPPLKRAIVWSEILGPPMGERDPRR